MSVWMQALGLQKLHGGRVWEEFLIWMGWQSWKCYDPGQHKRISLILLPTTRLAGAYMAFGLLLRRAAEGEDSLLYLDDIRIGETAYTWRNRLHTQSQEMLPYFVKGTIICNKSMKKKMLRLECKQTGGKLPQDLQELTLGTPGRRYSRTKFPTRQNVNTSRFCENLGGVKHPEALYAQTDAVWIYSSNLTQLESDLNGRILAVQSPDKESEISSCSLNDLVGAGKQENCPTHLKSPSHRDEHPPDQTTQLILEGARSFSLCSPSELEFGSIIVLLSHEEYADDPVHAKVDEIIGYRKNPDNEPRLQFPEEASFPGGIDVIVLNG